MGRKKRGFPLIEEGKKKIWNSETLEEGSPGEEETRKNRKTLKEDKKRIKKNHKMKDI